VHRPEKLAHLYLHLRQARANCAHSLLDSQRVRLLVEFSNDSSLAALLRHKCRTVQNTVTRNLFEYRNLRNHLFIYLNALDCGVVGNH
jgi:hypothetical protein